MPGKKRKRTRRDRCEDYPKQRKTSTAVTGIESESVGIKERVYTCKLCGIKSRNAPFFSNHVRECKAKAKGKLAIIDEASGKPILDGVLVSISVWQNTTLRESPLSRVWDESKVKTLLTELGATYSRNVHKRVNYLVVSEDAVVRNTQSVRKAAKRSVPMVKAEFLVACKTARSRVDHTPYVVTGKQADGMHTKQKLDSEIHVNELKEAKGDLKSKVLMEHAQTFDLGCCCACHDLKSNDCEWCHDVCYV